MIQFEKLRWKNFLSYGNQFTEIDLTGAKTTLVVGENGAGKTTFIDAICFGLYNKSFRSINKPQLVNSITQKSLLVEVEFSINGRAYLVRRGMKPNVFEIYKDGTLLDQTTGTYDYQGVLEKQILKMNFKSFTQIVILGSANYVPFMKLTAQARREVIEDLLDIQVFSVMNSLLKEKVNRNKTNLADIDYKIELTRKQIELNEKHIQDKKNATETVIQAKEEKVKEFTKAKADEEATKIELWDLCETYKKTRAKKVKRLGAINKLLSMAAVAENQITTLQKEIEFYTHTENCPTCKQTIDLDFRQATMESKQALIEKIQSGLQSMEKEKAEKEAITEEIAKLENEYATFHGQYHSSNTQIQAYVTYISDLTAEIEHYRNQMATIKMEDNTTQALYDELGEHVKQKTKLLDERSIFSVASVLLKDGGIKGKIVSQYIPIMNDLINHYLSELDFFVNFELDENFSEKIKSRYRDEFSYESFSEGEKIRINLALLFAWTTIAKMRNSAACSLLIMDEVLDGSLDQEGTDLFLKLLGQVIGNRNVFVISHKWNMQDKFERTLSFRKEKNFSRMS